MRKTLRIILAIFLVVTLLSTTVFAVQDRWANVCSITPRVSGGYDHYSCIVEGQPGTTKIACTLTLYEESENGDFIEVSYASETCYTHRHTFVGYYNVKRGKTYKLVTEVTVTCNGIAEDVSSTSEINC